MSVNVYNKTEDKLIPVAGGTVYADSPIGSIIPYGGNSVPSGWLLCQGQAISRTTYAKLFAVIGESFGTGDGSTTFNIPDLREATTKGAGLNGKSNNHYDADGIALGEFVEDRIKNHRHTYSGSTDTISGDNWAGMGPVGFTVGDMAAFGAGRATVSNGAGVWRADGTNKKIVEGYAVNIDLAHIHAYHGTTDYKGYDTNEVKAVGVNYIIKAKHTSVPTDFSDSLIGYIGQESNYNLYPWSHERTVEGADDNQNITIERDGWYSIDYTLTSNIDAPHTFTFRDFDSQGEVHTIMRAHYDKSGTFRQTFLVPLKAGTYRYSHAGIGTLSVYMNRRDFA